VTSWPATLLASLLMLLGLRAGLNASASAASAMLFALAPFVLLAGLHGRVGGYLHGQHRLALLSLPLEAKSHWVAAGANRRRAFALSALLATLLLGGGIALGWLPGAWTLLAEWMAFLLMVAVLEPTVPAWSAYLGRRFADDSPAARAQSSLGGGWTQPEAVVHLYAPSLMLLAAAALAMPAQLSLERLALGKPLEGAHWAITVAPLLLALYWRAGASSKYAEGFHEAVPWVHEAERTLSGPPVPRRTPAWVRLFSNPWTRTRAISLWRTTSGASLRLLGVGLAIGLPWLVDASDWGLALPFCLALVAIWVAPVLQLAATRWTWQEMSLRLPTTRTMQGVDLRLASVWAGAPLAVVGTSLLISYSRFGGLG
jgi:hypothetical protein